MEVHAYVHRHVLDTHTHTHTHTHTYTQAHAFWTKMPMFVENVLLWLGKREVGVRETISSREGETATGGKIHNIEKDEQGL